ncbi:MAG: UDP-N-acetylmuramoyl-L-alanyl-D-glutamate--2,6-diaminopimelate ligase [Bermanella sp.]
MIEINQNAKNFFKNWLDELPDFINRIEIKNLCFDSREVKPGDVFVAMPSVARNEPQYIKAALENGATLILAEKNYTDEMVGSSLIIPRLPEWIGEVLHEVLGRACEKMNAIGITGTNGKSSISFYLAQLLNELNKPCAVMGTLGYGDWQALTETGMTTLPVDKLHKVLAELSEQHRAIAIEVSSHGLKQGRLAGVQFQAAIYSNLSRDHLDYHGTMEAYGAAKARLFQWPSLQFAIINSDDEFSEELIKQTSCERIICYGQSQSADLKFKITEIHNNGMTVRFTWLGQEQSMELPLYGEFNAYNVAASLACVLQMGFDFNESVLALSKIKPVPGRMQQIKSNKHKPLVLVDYAHTPDALQQALLAVKRHCLGKIHLVVGCGGDRDQGKRALMGAIALKCADRIVFTSDNPRTEAASKICLDMTVGLNPERYSVELDRNKAIVNSVLEAAENDLVLIAGKGHENYQEINGQRFYFSDELVAQEALLLGNKA